MTFQTFSVQAMSNDPESIGELLTTFTEELISRVTIWGTAHNEDARAAVEQFRGAIRAAETSKEPADMPSFTTLDTPIVHLTPHAAIISFRISVTLEGLLAFPIYLSKLGFKYVIRQGDEHEHFSGNCSETNKSNQVLIF